MISVLASANCLCLIQVEILLVLDISDLKNRVMYVWGIMSWDSVSYVHFCFSRPPLTPCWWGRGAPALFLPGGERKHSSLLSWYRHQGRCQAPVSSGWGKESSLLTRLPVTLHWLGGGTFLPFLKWSMLTSRSGGGTPVTTGWWQKVQLLIGFLRHWWGGEGMPHYHGGSDLGPHMDSTTPYGHLLLAAQE